MSSPLPSLRLPARRDAGFVLAWALGLVFLVPVQLASMIAFDETGLDTLAPDLVFMAVFPAVVLAAVPTLVARFLYTRRAAGLTAAVGVTAFVLVTAYTMGFYGMCGPGC